MTPVPRPRAREHSADRAEQEMLDSSTRVVPECHSQTVWQPPSSLCIPNRASWLEQGTRRGEAMKGSSCSPCFECNQPQNFSSWRGPTGSQRIPKLCMVAQSYKMTQVFKGHLPSRNTEDHTCLNYEVRLLLIQRSQVGWTRHRLRHSHSRNPSHQDSTPNPGRQKPQTPSPCLPSAHG